MPGDLLHRAAFESHGETSTRLLAEQGGEVGAEAKAWLAEQQVLRDSASADERDAREEETLRMAREALSTAIEANRIASEDLAAARASAAAAAAQASSARQQAVWARWAAVIATIAVIAAKKTGSEKNGVKKKTGSGLSLSYERLSETFNPYKFQSEELPFSWRLKLLSCCPAGQKNQRGRNCASCFDRVPFMPTRIQVFEEQLNSESN